MRKTIYFSLLVLIIGLSGCGNQPAPAQKAPAAPANVIDRRNAAYLIGTFLRDISGCSGDRASASG